MASSVFHKPSKILTELNSNALMAEWSSRHHVDNVFENRFQLYDYVNSTMLGSESIDYLEFGVFEGQSLFKWSDINNNTDSRLYGFDSFEGLPEQQDDGVFRKVAENHFNVDGRVPQTDDKRIHFIKGYFQNVLQQFLSEFTPGNRLVVHNDSDLYSSTLYSLTMLDSILEGGSILIFDEFYSSSYEFQAFMDYTKSYLREYELIATVGNFPYMQCAILIK